MYQALGLTSGNRSHTKCTLFYFLSISPSSGISFKYKLINHFSRISFFIFPPFPPLQKVSFNTVFAQKQEPCDFGKNPSSLFLFRFIINEIWTKTCRRKTGQPEGDYSRPYKFHSQRFPQTGRRRGSFFFLAPKPKRIREKKKKGSFRSGENDINDLGHLHNKKE